MDNSGGRGKSEGDEEKALQLTRVSWRAEIDSWSWRCYPNGNAMSPIGYSVLGNLGVFARLHFGGGTRNSIQLVRDKTALETLDVVSVHIPVLDHVAFAFGARF